MSWPRESRRLETVSRRLGLVSGGEGLVLISVLSFNVSCSSMHAVGISNQILVSGYRMFAFLPRCIECSRGIAMGILSVRLSVRPSVKHMHCDKTEESYV